MRTEGHSSSRWLVSLLAALGATGLVIGLWPRGGILTRLSFVELDRVARPVGETGVHLLRLALILAGGVGLVLAVASAMAPEWVTGARRSLANQLLTVRENASPPPARTGEPGWAIVLVLVLIGVVVRLPYLSHPVSYDEAITYVFFASRSILDVASDYSIPNNHVLHSLLVKASEAVFGPGTLPMRLPALAAGLTVIPLTFMTARLWAGARVGILSAGLVATAPLLVEYSTQARGYTMVTALFLCGLVIAESLRRAPNAVGYLLFAATFALAGYTVPTGVMGFAVCYARLLDHSPPGRRPRVAALMWTTVLAAVLSAVFWLPVIVRSGWRAVLANKYVRGESFVAPKGILELTSSTFDCWTGVASMGGVAAWLAFAGLGLLWLRSRDSPLITLAAFIPLLVLGLIVGLQAVPPPRTLQFAFPFFAMLVGAGVISVIELVTATPASRDRAAILLAILVAVGWGVSRWSREPVWHSVDKIVASGRTPGANQSMVCAEGFFLDAEPIALALAPRVTPRSTIAAPAFSGMNETLAYYLLRAGHNPAWQQPFRSDEGIGQLEGFDTVFLVVSRPSPSRPAGLEDLLAAYDLSTREIAEAGFRLRPFSRGRTADVYALTAANPRPDEPPPERRPMRYPG